MRRTLEIVAVFTLAFMVAPLAHTQAPIGSQKVSWVAPTQFADGSAIPSTAAVTFNVYAKMGTAAEVKLKSALTETSFTTSGLPVGQSNCYTITVVVNGVESARSAEACGVVVGLASKPVTTIVIQ